MLRIKIMSLFYRPLCLVDMSVRKWYPLISQRLYSNALTWPSDSCQAIRDIDILHTLHMKEYTILHILDDWWSKIKKEKGWRDKLHVVGTTSESLDHLWAHAHACDPVASTWVAHEVSNMFCQTSQNMVRLSPCSCIDKVWNNFTPYRSHNMHLYPQHMYPFIEKLTARSTKHLWLHGTVLSAYSRCWHVRNTCLRSL
jgi:hypothetical protein